MTTDSIRAKISNAQQQEKSIAPLQTYHLSHDLRGPLNSVLGFTELLLEGVEGPLNDIQQEDIGAIRSSAQNLLTLINTVVDLGKLDANRIKLNFGPINFATCVKNGITSVTDSNKQVEIVTDIPKNLPSIWADYERAQQMVGYLLAYMLSKKIKNKIHISVSCTNAEATTKISAADLFISPGKLALLFQLTVEVDVTGQSKITEGGIFLPYVYKLAKKHQGNLWVESSPETGTSFYLKLPVYQYQPE